MPMTNKALMFLLGAVVAVASACSDADSVTVSDATWRASDRSGGGWQVTGRADDGAALSLSVAEPPPEETATSSSALVSKGPGVAYPPGPGGSGCYLCYCLPVPCLATIPDPTPRCYDCNFCVPTPCARTQ
jgi:hypothetical protein